MANEITIKIKSLDETDYGPALEKARKFSEEVHKALNESAKIDVKVDTAEAEEKIKHIEEELARLNGDDATIKVKVKEEDVKATEDKIKKKMDDSGSSSGKGWASRFTKALQSFDFKPGLLPVGLAVGAAFLPLIGASIAGAVVGSVGLGGIVGGVVIAAHDPRVKSAFKEMKTDLGQSLKLDAAPFVPVVISALHQIKTEVHQLNLGQIFADLAPQVQPVLSGILDLVGSLGDAIRNIVAKSGPVMQELGTDFRNLGRTLDSALSSLADNSKNEALALHDLFALIDGSIATVFALVDAFTAVYGAFHKLYELSPEGIYSKIQDGTQGVTGAVQDTIAAAQEQIDTNHGLAHSWTNAADAADQQTKAIKGVADALKAATDPAFAFIDAQKQVNDAQSAYDKAVKSSGKNSAAARNAQIDLEKAMINYVSAASGARSGTDHLTSAQKAMLRSAGFSSSAIKDLDKHLKDAYNSAKKIDGFDVTLSVEYQRTYTTYGKPFSVELPPTQVFHGLASGGISGAANGATSSGLTWVGENGPELLKLPAGTAVRSHGDSMRMAGGSGGGGDGSMITVPLVIDGRTLATVIIDPIRRKVWQDHGGNVQAALGRG